MNTAALAAEVLEELGQPPTHAPTMGVVAKMDYSHTDMIDFIIAHPGCKQKDLALRYGYSESWVSNFMSSDAWATQRAARREELVDPSLALTINERFKALTEKSLERLMGKLEAPQVSDNVVLRAVELGAKALGVGGNANAQPPADRGADHLAVLANRLLDLQSRVRAQQPPTIDVTPLQGETAA